MQPTLQSAIVASLLAFPLTAQTTVTATVDEALGTGQFVSGTVPTGTDVSGGHSMGWNLVLSVATLNFSVTQEASSILFVFHQVGNAGYPIAAAATGGIDVTCTSPGEVPVDVRVTVSHQTGDWGLAQGTLTAPGLSPGIAFWDYANTQPTSPPTVFVREFSTTITPGGTTFEMFMQAQSGTGFGHGGVANCSMSVEITPSDLATSYGTPCGTTLDFVSDLDTPPQATVTDASSNFGILLIGSNRTDIPLSSIVPFPWPCSLRTDILVSIPLPIGPPTGAFTFDFLPPPGNWTMQALTTDGVTVSTSNGLEFDS